MWNLVGWGSQKMSEEISEEIVSTELHRFWDNIDQWSTMLCFTRQRSRVQNWLSTIYVHSRSSEKLKLPIFLFFSLKIGFLPLPQIYVFYFFSESSPKNNQKQNLIKTC
jgi:hypothetical protein